MGSLEGFLEGAWSKALRSDKVSNGSWNDVCLRRVENGSEQGSSQGYPAVAHSDEADTTVKDQPRPTWNPRWAPIGVAKPCSLWEGVPKAPRL